MVDGCTAIFLNVYKKMKKEVKNSHKNTKTFSKVDFLDDEEEGRQDIYYWSEKRKKRFHGYRKSIHIFQIFGFNLHLLRSFVENFNFMVLLQMSLAALVTYLCKTFGIVYDVHVSLFISPIVFPLAFSINTDFQRKEKVLEDLANFKSSAMMWFFCIRDWREACSMDVEFMRAVRNKIKGIMFHLREYLLTEKIDRRRFIVRVIYEDLSDANQLNDKVRCSPMNANSPLVSRIIHFVNMMCLSFERLRVIREYRSPRSIRSFTKVLIFALPLLLSPYYVHLGMKGNLEDNRVNSWSPYYISVMVAFVFGALQGVQDKLDDPFDGMSEDDINLDTLDEWTLQSLEATCHRSYKIGRFQVVSSNLEAKDSPQVPPVSKVEVENSEKFAKIANIFNKDRFQALSSNKGVGTTPANSPLIFGRMRSRDEIKVDELELHPYAGVLNNIQGNTTILRGGHVKIREKSYDDLGSMDRKTSILSNIHEASFPGEQTSQTTLTTNLPYNNSDREMSAGYNLPSVEIIDHSMQQQSAVSAPALSLDFSGGEAPTYGVASYLAAALKNSSSRSQHDPYISSRRNSASSGHSRKSSRSSLCSNPEFVNDNNKAEFYMGDEVIKKSPSFQSSLNPRFKISKKDSNAHPLIVNTNTLDCEEDYGEETFGEEARDSPLCDKIPLNSYTPRDKSSTRKIFPNGIVSKCRTIDESSTDNSVIGNGIACEIKEDDAFFQ